MPSGFYWGGFGQSLGQGLSNIGQMLAEKGKFDEQKKENDLRRKMLDLQIQKATREQSEAETRDRLLSDIANSMSQPVGQSIFQGVEEEGAGLSGPPAAPTRPKTLEDIKQDPTILGKLAQVQPKEFAAGLMKQLMPGSSGGLVRDGYKTPQEAVLAARNAGMPVARIKQGVDGLWRAEGSEPVNYGALLAQGAKARVLQQGGTPEQAEAAGLAAANLYQFQQRASGQMGSMEAEFAPPGSPLPPSPGISAPQAPTPPAPSTMNQQGATPAQPPLQAPQVPQPAQGPYPTQAGGPPKSRLETQADIRRRAQPVPESSDAAITSMHTLLQQLDRINPKAPGTLYSQQYVGPIAGVAGGIREKFGETPYVGGLVGGPITTDEAQFRQVVNSIYNEIANLRGGKVLPEQELKRIEKEAVTLTTSPTAFEARYEGFRNMIQNMLQNRINVVGASRGSIGEIPEPPAGWRRR